MNIRNDQWVWLALLILSFLAILLMGILFSTLARGNDSLPDLLPALVPQVQTIEVSATADVRRQPVKKVVEKVWGIVGWSRACPSCPLAPTYGWIDQQTEATADEVEAADVVDRMARGKSTPEDLAKLEKEVPAKTIRKVLEQRWSIGSCGMYCKSHGSRLYNVYDDGKVEPAPDEPDSALQEGASAERTRFRLFRGRR